MKPTKGLFGVALTVVLLSLTLFFLRDFNLIWTKISNEGAQVTINFLIPMNQDKLEDSIRIRSNKLYSNTFESSIVWEGPHTCTLMIKESGIIRGQKVELIVDKAPTMYKGIRKNATIPIQFKTDVKIIEPTSEILITTEKPFYIQFNTPMDEHILDKYLQADSSFYIEAVEATNEYGKKQKDETTFKFTPKTKLLNNHKYLLSFRKGMPSKAGNILLETLQVALVTDEKPLIERVIPSDGSKWVGLYPRITVESVTPIEKAFLEIEGQVLEGTLKNQYRAEFYMPHVLKAAQNYSATIQIQALSGELSDKEALHFTTVPIPNERIWAEIIVGENQEMRIYQGQQEINRLICSAGSSKTPTSMGTYYLQEKGESYYDNDTKEGANYYMQLSEGIIMHGMSRDENWQFKSSVYNNLGKGQTKGKVIFKEEDALWLYENLPLDGMIIIHK